MADRKYLLKRGGVWYVRFRLPARLGGGIFLRSLGTGDITAARKYRDLHIMPFLAGEDQFAATEALIEKAVQFRAAQDQRFKNLQAGRLSEDRGESDAITLRTLADRYLAHVKQGDLSPATIQAYTGHLQGFLSIVGDDRPAQSIQKTDIAAYRDRLLELPVNWMRLKELPLPGEAKRTVSPAQVGNALAYIRGFFQWAINDGLIEAMLNPAQGVKAPFAGERKKRPFTREEADAACNLPMPKTRAFDEEAWRSLPLIARYTGARLGEIAQLTGNDVVEIHGVRCLHIFERESKGKRTKTHTERYVPVANKIKSLVDKLRKNHGIEPLFPKCGTWTDQRFGVVKPAKIFGNAFQKAVKMIAPDLSFHSFRHYAISEMANSGVPEEVRMRIVGHKGRSVHAGYTQIDISVMAKAVETIY